MSSLNIISPLEIPDDLKQKCASLIESLEEVDIKLQEINKNKQELLDDYINNTYKIVEEHKHIEMQSKKISIKVDDYIDIVKNTAALEEQKIKESKNTTEQKIKEIEELEHKHLNDKKDDLKKVDNIKKDAVQEMLNKMNEIEASIDTSLIDSSLIDTNDPEIDSYCELLSQESETDADLGTEYGTSPQTLQESQITNEPNADIEITLSRVDSIVETLGNEVTAICNKVNTICNEVVCINNVAEENVTDNEAPSIYHEEVILAMPENPINSEIHSSQSTIVPQPNYETVDYIEDYLKAFKVTGEYDDFMFLYKELTDEIELSGESTEEKKIPVWTLGTLKNKYENALIKLRNEEQEILAMEQKRQKVKKLLNDYMKNVKELTVVGDVNLNKNPESSAKIQKNKKAAMTLAFNLKKQIKQYLDVMGTTVDKLDVNEAPNEKRLISLKTQIEIIASKKERIERIQNKINLSKEST